MSHVSGQQTPRVVVRYVRHIHKYSYTATPSPPVLEEEDVGSEGRSPDQGRGLGYQLGSSVHQLREEFHICPHNFLPGLHSQEYRDSIYSLPHSRRDCRPCFACVDVWFEHNHACPPVVVANTVSTMGWQCNSRCMIYGLNCRPRRGEFPALHHCLGPGGEEGRQYIPIGRPRAIDEPRVPAALERSLPHPAPMRLRSRLIEVPGGSRAD